MRVMQTSGKPPLIESLEPRMLLSATDVLTYHNDVARTGAYLHEKLLTPSNVSPATFGKRFDLPVDGKVDAQPLYISHLRFAGANGNRAAAHNVVYVATEYDSLYAFDADSGEKLWQVSVLGAGETPSDPRNCGQIVPEIGITATPVIDRSRGPHGMIYLVAMSKDGAGHYFQRLHALDLTTGAEMLGGPRTVSASYPGTGDDSAPGSGGPEPNVIFDPAQYDDRAALLLSHGVIYTSWSSHCDIRPYTSWLIGYSARTLAQTSILNFTPNGSEGAFWGSGGGPAADAAGNLYLLTGNGTFDPALSSTGFPAQGDYGDAFVKVSPRRGLHVTDYFSPFNEAYLNSVDFDLGSSAPLLLPPMTDSRGHTRLLAVGAAKDAVVYVVDRNHMGKLNTVSADNHNIYQEVRSVLNGGVFSTPAYFDRTLYYGPVSDYLRAFTIDKARLSATSVSQTSQTFGYPGTSPSISANGNRNAILWAVENGDTAVLHAYDAHDLTHELYNSGQMGARDAFAGNKFITPTVAGGEVFVGTPNSVAVFGLL